MDIVTAYAAAVTLYGNAQRSGVITNLTIAEFGMRQDETEGFVVIPCVHHKTGSQGLAQLVVPQECEDMLEYYYNTIRIKIKPAEDGHQGRFFLTYTGQEYTQVYRRIKEALSTGDLCPPQPSHYRILISSEARRHLNEQKQRNVIKHLSHSVQTSQKYYEFMNTTDATEAHGTIRMLSLQRRWSKEDIAKLISQWPLAGKAPLIRDCRVFIKDNNITRTPKDIVYKWQQLAATQLQ